MDGRWPAALLTLVLPAVLIAVTVAKFASNPVAVLSLVAVMFGGMFYLLSYAEMF